MVGDWILDDFEKLLLRICRTDGQPVQQLHHQAGKAFEGAGDANRRADLYQNAFGGVYINLKPAGFVDWGIEQGKETLKGESGRCKLSANQAEARRLSIRT